MYPLWSASILENSSLMAWSVKIKVGRAQVGLSLHRSRRAASPRTWRTRWSRCPGCRPYPRRGWGLWPPHPPSDLRPGGEIQYIYYNEDDEDNDDLGDEARELLSRDEAVTICVEKFESLGENERNASKQISTLFHLSKLCLVSSSHCLICVKAEVSKVDWASHVAEVKNITF